jgi:hypothetical protein
MNNPPKARWNYPRIRLSSPRKRAFLDYNGAMSTPLLTRTWRTLQTPWALAIGFFVVGPFVLPVLWKSDRYSRRQKGIWTVVILAVTALLGWAFLVAVDRLTGELGGSLESLLPPSDP